MLISQALEGKYYRSRSYVRKGQDGIIQFAERYSMLDNDNEYCYKIQVRPTYTGEGYPKPDFWATMWVGVDND